MRLIHGFAVMGLFVAALTACGGPAEEDAGATAPPASALPESAPTAAGGDVYGEPRDDLEVVKISELAAQLDAYEGKDVRVEGPVVGVCAKRGCWIKLGSDAEFQTLTFKVQDGVMVFPMSAHGKHAVADGTVRKVELDLEQTRNYLAHQAEESGEKFDPASVTEPMTMVRLDGIGARITDGATK